MLIHIHRLLITAALAYLNGCIWVYNPLYAVVFTAISILIIDTSFSYFSEPSQKTWFHFFLIVTVTFGFLSGLLRTQRVWPITLTTSLTYAGNAVIIAEPDRREKYQNLTLALDAETRVLAKLPLTTSYNYGSLVFISGTLTPPKSSPQFNYPAYLQMRGIHYIAQYPELYVLQKKYRQDYKWYLYELKDRFVKRIQRSIDPPYDALLLGILLGARRGIPQSLQETFTAVGLSHIVAISGYNVNVIANFFERIFSRQTRSVSTALSAFGITGLVIASGSSGAVVRAGYMSGLFLCARLFYRKANVHVVLLYAVTIMILINPLQLFWDMSFQLSFLATAGMLYIIPIVEYYVPVQKKLFIFETIIGTIAATLATVPFILLKSGMLSTMTLLANLLVLPCIPLVMLLGFLTVLPVIGIGFGWVTQLLLTYISWVAQTFADAAVNARVLNLQSNTVLTMYVILAVWVLLHARTHQKFKPS